MVVLKLHVETVMRLKKGDWGGFMYKKCVSYMYEYEYGRKGENVGFAKVAIQNQIVKVQIQLQHIKRDGKWSVYSFQRNGEEIKTERLGTGMVTEGNGTFELEEQTSKLWKQGAFLIQGFLLLPEEGLEKDGKAYGCMSKWDDGAVIWDRIDRLQEKRAERVLEQEPAAVSKETSENGREPVSEPEIQRQQLDLGENIQESSIVGSNIQEWNSEKEKFEEKEVEEEECEVICVEAIHKECEETDRIESMEKEQEARKKISEDMEKQMAMENQFALEEQQQQYSWEAFEKRRAQMCSELEKMKEKEEEEKEETKEIKETKEQDEKEMGGEENRKENMEENKGEKREKDGTWEVGEQFLREGMVMNPFYDTDVIAAVRMEPRDLGRLPIEFWYLANNSFLLHGYYSYRHLLFMKMRNREECQYAIGVPGNEKEQENFMANMFGFQHFKRVNRKENEKFGYWWLRLM